MSDTTQTLNVHYLPQHVPEQDLAGSAVIVIDVLRATTTICQALAAGAREVVPFREIDETLEAAQRVGRANVVLGGERGGQRIEGFDLGNSPSEYTAEAVAGRPVFITTSNGTQALYHARLARRVIVGAMVNLSAVAASVKDEPQVNILCAGTDGRETQDDILAAGAIASRIRELSGEGWLLNGTAEAAMYHWGELQQAAVESGRPIIQQLAIDLCNTPGGRNLVQVWFLNDLVDCAQIDRLEIVPELDVNAWRITIPRA